MSYADTIFIQNCKDILSSEYNDFGMNIRPRWSDGTEAHTKKILYQQNRYTLTPHRIPVITLKKLGFKNCIDELLWIYQKKSNKISELNSHIWDSWDVGDGTIGKAYGYQIGQMSRHHKMLPCEIESGMLDGIEYDTTITSEGTWVWLSQIDAVLWDLRNNKSSRSIMTNTYVHQDLADMGLRPCAYMMTFNVTKSSDNKYVLNGKLTQRSQDMLVANGWNVAQYAVLLQMLAQVSNMQPGIFVHEVADMHIYDRHIPIVEKIIHMPQHPDPTFMINPAVKSFYDFAVDDFELIGYEYNKISDKIEVAV